MGKLLSLHFNFNFVYGKVRLLREPVKQDVDAFFLDSILCHDNKWNKFVLLKFRLAESYLAAILRLSRKETQGQSLPYGDRTMFVIKGG